MWRRNFRCASAALAVALGVGLAGCGGDDRGGGGTDPAPVAMPAQVEYLAHVRQVPAEDEATIAEPAVGTLVHTTAAPYAAGDVLLWQGRAFKVMTVQATGPGQVGYSTATPDFEEVFESLRIDADVAINTRAGASNAPRERSRLVFDVPGYTIKPELPVKGLSVQGDIKDARGTIVFDYSRREGLKRAELSLRGALTLDAAIGVSAANSPRRREFAAGSPISIPIPATLGTVAFKLPVGVFVELDSAVEARLFEWRTRYDFDVGTRYDPAARGFVNASSFKETGLRTSLPDASLLERALQAVVRSLTLTQKATLVRLFVGPTIKPALSALNDSVGVLGLRNELGLEAALELQGTFPTLVDCARIPVSLRNRVYAVLNYKRYESLLDFEGEDVEASAKIFEEGVALGDVRPLGACDQGVPYLSTYLTTAVDIGPPIREECNGQGVCSREMYCDPGDQPGASLEGPERWQLDAAAGTATLLSEDRAYRGTFDVVTGRIDVRNTQAPVETTPQGSTIRYFSTQAGTLAAIYDPLTRVIRGRSVENVATSWALDGRSVVCRAEFDYESQPVR
jgi:hypothetical protein